MKRRNFLKGLFAAPVAAKAAETFKWNDATGKVDVVSQSSGFGMAPLKAEGQAVVCDGGVITTGNMPRLLQEGIDAAFKDAYADCPTEFDKIFS